MPRRSVRTIAHSTVTDQRIPRVPAKAVQAGESPGATGGTYELIHHTRRADSSEAEPDLRTLALAYNHVSLFVPAYSTKAFPLLEKAASEYPTDMQVQGEYGAALMRRSRSGQSLREATSALELTIALGSKSPDVRIGLAGLQMQTGQIDSAVQLLQDAT